jgi:hypothetical protein
MALKLKVARALVFPVKGELTLEDGSVGAFDFRLRAQRLDVEEIDARFKAGATRGEFLAPLVQGWQDVLDEDGAPVAFSQEALADLLKIAGMATVAFNAYMACVQAREKN